MGVEGGRLRSKLQENVRSLVLLLRATGLVPPALAAAAGGHALLSPIVPLAMGSEEMATEASQFLLERCGIFCPAIRPPTVPRGTSRLRIAVTASHTPSQLEALADALMRFLEHKKPRSRL